MGARTIHPFPARMAPEIAIENLPRPSKGTSVVVLDPMCGSGTVLSAAIAKGHTARGFDVDPLAVLMSTVATRPISTKRFLETVGDVVSVAQSSSSGIPSWFDDETLRFSEFWFGAKQRRQLTEITGAISLVEDKFLRDAMQVALSRIIVTKSPKASLAADASHSRPHRVITSSDYDVVDGFAESAKGLARLLDARRMTGIAEIQLGDARDIPLAAESVDLVVTSPPYLNAIDYLRGHKLALVWFGHTIPEIRQIRSNSIGAERRLDKKAHKHAIQIVDKIKDETAQPDLLPSGTLERYAEDLVLFGQEIYRVCKPGVDVVTVIGNSTLKGNYIRNDAMVRLAYELAGFSFTSHAERDLPENRRYMPVNAAAQKDQSAMTKRMRTEVVLTVSKRRSIN